MVDKPAIHPVLNLIIIPYVYVSNRPRRMPQAPARHHPAKFPIPVLQMVAKGVARPIRGDFPYPHFLADAFQSLVYRPLEIVGIAVTKRKHPIPSLVFLDQR